MKDSLSQEALGHDSELPPAVFDQMATLGHHHVVELLSFLCDHNVSVPLHSQFETWTQRETVKDMLKEAPTAVKSTEDITTLQKNSTAYLTRVDAKFLKKMKLDDNWVRL